MNEEKCKLSLLQNAIEDRRAMLLLHVQVHHREATGHGADDTVYLTTGTVRLDSLFLVLSCYQLHFQI